MSIPLAIVGLGKMGRLVEQLAPQHGFSVVARFTSSNAASLSRETLAGATTAIEFSTPAAALENLCRLATLGGRTVSGTTGWYDHLPQIRNSVETAGSALLYGPNFSVGVNLFFQIVARAATLLSKHPEYEAWGWEIHHSAKKDAPSGTHEVGFDSPADTITLRHTARSREGYAHGALQAARWLQQKKGVYEFRDIVSELGAAKVSD